MSAEAIALSFAVLGEDPDTYFSLTAEEVVKKMFLAIDKVEGQIIDVNHESVTGKTMEQIEERTTQHNKLEGDLIVLKDGNRMCRALGCREGSLQDGCTTCWNHSW